MTLGQCLFLNKYEYQLSVTTNSHIKHNTQYIFLKLLLCFKLKKLISYFNCALSVAIAALGLSEDVTLHLWRRIPVRAHIFNTVVFILVEIC